MVAASIWQRRIQRAQELAEKHSFSREILGFYVHLARFQEKQHFELTKALARQSSDLHRELGAEELSELRSRLSSFLSMAEKHGPQKLAELAGELSTRDEASQTALLSSSWISHSSSDVKTIMALLFLQPYAELLRSRAKPAKSFHTYAICPFCNRKPGFGVMRQMGDGAARSLVCSFCLAEWEFRRLVCPGCGEENDRKLSVFTANEFDYMRVECCESCKTYMKTIDLTRNGNAEPLVDELASAPLDLWAREQGYAKLQNNLLGM